MNDEAREIDVQGSRRVARGHSSTGLSHPADTGFLSMNSSWSQKPAVDPLPQINGDEPSSSSPPRLPRVHSAHVHETRSPKTRRRFPSRPKSSNPRETRSPTATNNDLCRITMVYYGSHAKLDNHPTTLFDSKEEILVMQQHCGGENLIVFKQNLRAGGKRSSLLFSARSAREF